MNNAISPFEIAAAGLLHDVGKVLEPAQVSRNPAAAGSNFGGMDRARIERLANHHHPPSPDRLDEHLLTKADWLARGHDQQPTEIEEPRTGLAAIIATLSWPDAFQLGRASDEWILPTAPLSFEASRSFPQEKQNQAEYQEHCRALADQLFAGLQTDYDDAEQCIDGLLGLTQRLLHAVPASRSRGQIPDVSLYDHSRMVAAIAACLAVLPHEGPIATNNVRGRFRFVTLGVGGIQNFIFRSVPQLEPNDSGSDSKDSKGSAKRLRARSFFLSLYSWVASRKVLQAAGMPMTNLIYDAGGHALLLIPDTPDIVQAIERRLNEIALEIRSSLGGTLRFDYAVGKSHQEDMFHRDRFQTVLREIESARANSRYRFPDSRLHNESGWSEEEWVASGKPSLPVDRDDFLKPMRELGNALPKAEYLAIGGNNHGIWNGTVLELPISLHAAKPRSGRCFALALHENDPTTGLLLSGSHLPKANDEDVKRLGDPTNSDAYDDTIKPGETLTFSDLAHLSTTDDDRPVDHPMLGVLKADVDLLGGLMTYGFTTPGPSEGAADERGGNRATIGRLAGLSRSLDQFFKGFLTERIRETYPHIYTVFVGGDDLFLIGPWYDLVRFSRDFHRWFGKLTCGNPNVTFSAGLVFTKPTTPVQRLATLAEEVLEQAKEQGRDRIGYGSVTLTWKQFHDAWRLHEHLLACSRPGPDRASVNASLTYRLLQYAKQALDCGRHVQGKSPDGTLPFAVMKWRAQMNYDLKRNLPLPQKQEEELTKDQQELCDLHEALLKINSPDQAAVLYTAASLTLYLLRGEPT